MSPDGGAHVRYTALSCGIRQGVPVVCAILEGTKAGVTSQIAVKLALDAICERVLAGGHPEAKSEQILEAALSEANNRVYEYAGKMLSGAKVTAVGCLSAFDGKRLTLGRTGGFEAVIWRHGTVNPFFQQRERSGVEFERLIGAERRLLIDFASVNVEMGDSVIIANLRGEGDLGAMVSEALEKDIGPEELAHFLIAQSRLIEDDEEGPPEGNRRQSVACVLQFEPPPILLDQVVEE